MEKQIKNKGEILQLYGKKHGSELVLGLDRTLKRSHEAYVNFRMKDFGECHVQKIGRDKYEIESL